MTGRNRTEIGAADENRAGSRKILLFGGTSEGRRLAERLSAANFPAAVCVATEYGRKTMPELTGVELYQGRMDEGEMRAFMEAGDFLAVVDATHPYAADASRNIRKSAKDSGLVYLRLRREEVERTAPDGARERYYGSHEACAAALKKTTGNILLTTGSKNLGEYCQNKSMTERLFARVLPSAESIGICAENGLSGRQIIAMQGPFRTDLNMALIRQYGIRYLVTKESGRAGGFEEKRLAAARTKITLCVIENQEKEQDGLTFAQVCRRLEELAGEKKETIPRADESPLRGRIPMTKAEVRALAVCKLRLFEGAVVYDIGSGTGSVAMEIAARSGGIRVYAVEEKEERAALIQNGCSALHSDNLRVVPGTAPEALAGLPAPTHAFIGGSGGRLADILAALRRKNPFMRIVLTAVSLETVSEAASLLKALPVQGEEIVQIQVSRADKAGNYHLMRAENPVFLFSFDLAGGF